MLAVTAFGPQIAVLNPEKNRFGLAAINIRLGVEHGPGLAVLVVDLDPAHGEFAAVEARAGQVTLDQVDTIS